jgi:hypothetical protein
MKHILIDNFILLLLIFLAKFELVFKAGVDGVFDFVFEAVLQTVLFYLLPAASFLLVAGAVGVLLLAFFADY